MLNKDVRVEICSFCKVVPIVNPRAFQMPAVCSRECHNEAFKENRLTGVVQKLRDGNGVVRFAKQVGVSIDIATEAVWFVYDRMDQDQPMTKERASFASKCVLIKLEELKLQEHSE